MGSKVFLPTWRNDSFGVGGDGFHSQYTPASVIGRIRFSILNKKPGNNNYLAFLVIEANVEFNCQAIDVESEGTKQREAALKLVNRFF